MSMDVDELLPNAKDFMKKLALAEAEEAQKEAKAAARAEAEKRALIEQLKKPSGVSDEEGIRRAVAIIERAVRNGKSEVQVYRFTNALCTDRGRAINQQEKGWNYEKSLGWGARYSMKYDVPPGYYTGVSAPVYGAYEYGYSPYAFRTAYGCLPFNRHCPW